MSTAEQRTRLQADDPTPPEYFDKFVKRHFALDMPTKLSEFSLQLVREQIEFRRKCMNQGFDNLLELLEMHAKAVATFNEVEESEPST